MPHPNMANWQSIHRGKQVEYNPPKTVEEMAKAAIAYRDEAEYPNLMVDLPDVVFHEHVVMRAEGDTPTAEIYAPKEGTGPFPVFMHIHGGGWVFGAARHERRFCMRIAEQGFVVVNVDYALAPFKPWPRGLEDNVYAARWIVENIAEYGGDPTRVTIGGGSAGGNLTACTTLALHGSDEGLDGGDLAHVEVRFNGSVLLFGVLDVAHWIDRPHYYADFSEIFVQAYLGSTFTGKMRHPLVSPIENPHLDKLPPLYISVGCEDAFLSHSLRFTEKVADLDVPVTLSVVAGADHEFHKTPESVPNAQAENDRIVAWLHQHT